PYGWLREFVPAPAPPRELADRLTMAGFEVEEIHEVDGEAVLDVSVTSNRGDALSLTGIAREVAALYRARVAHPVVAVREAGPDITTLATVIVEAPDLCPRYAARVVLGVKIGPSPDYVRKRLLDAGVRPINNVVDATNYVMLELGQPLHAFDLDQLTDRTIIVRRARAEEPFTTLDGVERTLTNAMLVIADAARPVALAGIMGGLHSEVTEGTTNLLLESAHFDRTVIRRTARAQALGTESSYRFERIVDPAGVIHAVDRVTQLILEWAGGTAARGVIDVHAELPDQRVIVLRPARVNAVLGTEIAADEMIAALTGLEMDVRAEDGNLSVTIPTFRPDLVEETDLIEEVARIHGYERIPARVPGQITHAGRLAPELAFEGTVRELLTSAGLFEGTAYSLIDYRLLDQLQLPEDAPERVEIVPLRNPKSEEYTHLRPTLFVSLLESLRNNARRNIGDVQIFEIGRIFRNTGGGFRFDYAPRERRVEVDVRVQQAEMLPLEQRAAGIALMGRPWTARWGGGDTTVDFFWLKGLLEQFFADLGLPTVTYNPWQHPTLHPGRTAQARVADRVIGLLGELHPRVIANFDLPGRAYLAEMNIDALMDLAGTARPAPALSRFPAVDRDIAFLVRDDQPAREVETVLRGAAGPTLERLALFDVYTGAGIPAGQRSLAYRLTFRAEDRTLADEEVDAVMLNIRRALGDALSAVLR
ncbi:MAG TPA: phenylalanine--tRNA ligase subunit beta, partial [Armatimonadota bacterium]|nr:phenylalanine--tRNA ligase subunit beta [Armatimonadota bacterium]